MVRWKDEMKWKNELKDEIFYFFNSNEHEYLKRTYPKRLSLKHLTPKALSLRPIFHSRSKTNNLTLEIRDLKVFY